MSATSSKRIPYLDVLRCIGCLAVIMIHVSSCYITSESTSDWLSIIFDVISQFAVPLFVMISGALLLDERYSSPFQKIKGHCLNIIKFFLFWSTVYAIIFCNIVPICQHHYTSWKTTLIFICQGWTHLWYCFMLFGLYLVTPLLRLWIKKENKKYIEYFLILAFVFTSVLPEICSEFAYFSTYSYILENPLNNLGLDYLKGYVFYFILGWYLHNFH